MKEVTYELKDFKGDLLSTVKSRTPIIGIRNVQIFENGSLSNDDYHDQEKAPGVSSTALWAIFDHCEAQYKFSEKTTSPALEFGIASHAAMLEPELFDAEFVRDVAKDDYEDMITSTSVLKSKLKELGVITLVSDATKLMRENGALCSAADIKSYLKEVGIPYKTADSLDTLIAIVKEKTDKVLFFADGKTLAELEPEILALVPDAKIFTQEDNAAGILEAGRKFASHLPVLENLQAELRENNPGKTLVKAEDYDMIIAMRDVLFSQDQFTNLLAGAYVETSIVCEILLEGFENWIAVKIRPDIITADYHVPDYKTTRDVRPESFGRLAHESGYWLRQAFVTDVLDAALSVDSRPALLAQCKDAPYIPVWYNMSGAQIAIGREQYKEALIRYARSKETDCWPAYFDEPTELPTPSFIARKYGI